MSALVRIQTFLVVIIFSIVQSQTNQNNEYVSIKEIVENGYQSEVEVTKLTGENKTTTYTAYEFHDLERKRGRIDLLYGEISKSLYYFSDSQQTVIIEDNSCKVDSFKNASLNGQTLPWESLERKHMIGGPSSVLWRETITPPTLLNNSVAIRGIPCMLFGASDKEDDGAYFYFYISAPNWKGSEASNKSFPIRVEAKGHGSLITNTIIDFISFVPKIPKFSTFQIQAGVGCEGLKSNGLRTLPLVDDQFTYTSEVYNVYKSQENVQNHVLIYKFWFDATNQIMKSHGLDNKFQPLTAVADFSTGVEYTTAADGTCTFGGIKDLLFQREPSGVVRMMQDGNKFLGLDGTYYYLGKGFTRSVYCDIWETVKNNVYFFGQYYKKIIQTVYFMSPEITSVVSGDDNFQVPVKSEMRLQFNETSPVMLMEANMFEFDEAKMELFYDDISVERCFTPETQKDYFMVHFPADSEILNGKAFNKARVALNAKLAIVMAARVSLLRISIVRVFTNNEIGKSDISILGVMLDSPPAIAGFYMSDSEKPFVNEREVKSGIKGAGDCATACVSNNKCKGFTFCKGVVVKCYLTDNDVSDVDWGKSNHSVAADCQLYFRSDLNSRANQPNLTQALKNLEESVNSRKLKIHITSEKSLTSNKMEKRVTPFNWQDKDLYETAFTQRKLDKSVETVKEVLSTLSASECYQMCQDETGIFCSSFSFCRADGNCRLSSVFVDENRESSLEEMEKAPATSCNVYRKAAANFFEKYPGMTTQREGQKHQSTLASANECALACREEKSFSCKGFEFCETTRVCVMHDTHSLDLDVENKLKPGAPVCSHYSLKYSTEFADMGQFELTGPTSRIEKALTFEECAKACSVSSNSVCQSINYCKDSMISASRCQLFSVTSDDPGYELQNSKNCSHYIRRSQSSPRPSIGSVADGSDRVSGGQFAATIIGVIIFGIVLGAGTFLAYSMYRSRRHNADGTAERFVDSP